MHDCCEPQNRLTTLLTCTGWPLQARVRTLSYIIVAGATQHLALQLNDSHCPAGETAHPVFRGRSTLRVARSPARRGLW